MVNGVRVPAPSVAYAAVARRPRRVATLLVPNAYPGGAAPLAIPVLSETDRLRGLAFQKHGEIVRIGEHDMVVERA